VKAAAARLMSVLDATPHLPLKATLGRVAAGLRERMFGDLGSLYERRIAAQALARTRDQEFADALLLCARNPTPEHHRRLDEAEELAYMARWAARRIERRIALAGGRPLHV
jgi:hypothetical protein